MKNMRRPGPNGQKRSRDKGEEERDKENQDSNKPCKRKDTRDDRAGAKVAFTEDDSGEYERNVDALKEESKLEKPNSKTVRHLMKATFQGRRQWILSDSPPVEDVLEQFPPLKKTRCLQKELLRITEVADWDHVQDKWDYFSARIQALAAVESKQRPALNQLLQNQATELEAIDDEFRPLLEVLHSVEALTFLMVPRCKTKLIHRFSMEPDLDKEVMNLRENHPYIALVIGGASLQTFLTAERQILEPLKKGSTTLISLIAVYFTFNMIYPKQLYPILIFIQRFILDIQDKQVVPNSLTKLISSLDKLDC